MINNFLKHPTVIQPLQYVGLFVIGRLYFLLPKYRANLEEVLINLLQIFGQLEEAEEQHQACLLLSKILGCQETSEDFKDRLYADDKIQGLLKSNFFLEEIRE